MGHLEAAHPKYCLPDGRALLGDVSFRVGEEAVVALDGPNGAGKTTLLRLISGELKPHTRTPSWRAAPSSTSCGRSTPRTAAPPCPGCAATS